MNVTRETLLPVRILKFAVLLMVAIPTGAQPQSGTEGPPPHAATADITKVPSGVILVKGAWASASDTTTPIPEGGGISNNVYANEYFDLTFPLPTDFIEKYKGPPPSDSGFYVLAQLRPADTFKGAIRGTIQISAQDLFFSLSPAGDASSL